MDNYGNTKHNRIQIERQLKSAVEGLTPNILDRIDLSIPQEPVSFELRKQQSRILAWNKRVRQLSIVAAACLCLVVMGGGAASYQYQNRVVDSVIGIDVNPSVELSINRKNRVLEAKALNEEARTIIADMDLEGVDLNVAVNAVVGSMVTHGYLDDLENAILVTVSNDSIRKATELRTSVVGDIEKTLEENQVQAVVYDQQVIERDEMKALAEAYGISYGKAYFLKELIEQNKELTMEDMEELSSLSMEEIARRIADNSLALGDFAQRVEESKPVPATGEMTTEESTEASTTEATTEATTAPTAPSTTPPETTTTAPVTTAQETTQPKVEKGLVEIDYVDYEDGKVYVYFVTRVRWKNPTVSVRDEDGNSYAAMVEDTASGSCVIEAGSLEGGRSYTFVLGGLIPVEGDVATTVQGYFDKPEIAGEATTAADETTDESKETVPASTGEASTEATTAIPTVPPATEGTTPASTTPASSVAPETAGTTAVAK